jgi:hypothetical protein
LASSPTAGGLSVDALEIDAVVSTTLSSRSKTMDTDDAKDLFIEDLSKLKNIDTGVNTKRKTILFRSCTLLAKSFHTDRDDCGLRAISVRHNRIMAQSLNSKKWTEQSLPNGLPNKIAEMDLGSVC